MRYRMSTNDELKIISILCGNHCENFTIGAGIHTDVPRNKGNYVPRELLAWKTGRSQVSRSFLIFPWRNLLWPRNHFPAPQVKFETLRHYSPVSFAKKYSQSEFRFSPLRENSEFIFMWHWKFDIMSHCRNVSRSRSVHVFTNIIYSLWSWCGTQSAIFTTKIMIHCAVIWNNILPVIKNFFYIIVLFEIKNKICYFSIKVFIKKCK